MIDSTSISTPVPSRCAAVRMAIQRRFDGEAAEGETAGTRADALDPREIDAHLQACHPCAAFERDLSQVSSFVRSLPMEPMPRMDLAAVLARTVDAADGSASRSMPALAGPISAGPVSAGPVSGRSAPVASFASSGAPDRTRGRVRRRFTPLSFAAAAALLIATATAARLLAPGSNASSTFGPARGLAAEAELSTLEDDVEHVLALVAGALRGAERVAIQDILVGEAAPALRVLPIGPES